MGSFVKSNHLDELRKRKRIDYSSEIAFRQKWL